MTPSPMIRIFLALLALVVVARYSKILPLNGPFTVRLVIPNGVTIVIEQETSDASQAQPTEEWQFVDSRMSSIPGPGEPKKSILESVSSLSDYGDYQQRVLNRKRARFAEIPAHQYPLVESLGYKFHFTRAFEQIQTNALLAQDIAQHGREVYSISPKEEQGVAADFGIVSEAFSHLIRDWTELGQEDRDKLYPPIHEALSSSLAGISDEKNVLIPGFGLGRLAHEVAEKEGFYVTANDVDFTGIITYRYLLNRTSSAFEHTFYPFIMNWAQQYSTFSRFEAVKAPDYLPSPRSRDNVIIIEGDFVTAFSGHEYQKKYDAVITLFFIDVGESVIDFLMTILTVLKTGGTWINLGPLKFGAHSQLQLSAEEVLTLSEKMGFNVNHESRRSIETLYAHQPGSLLKYTYVAQFWTATKRGDVCVAD